MKRIRQHHDIDTGTGLSGSAKRSTVQELARIRQGLEAAERAYTGGADGLRILPELRAFAAAVRAIRRELLLDRIHQVLERKHLGSAQRQEVVRLFQLLLRA